MYKIVCFFYIKTAKTKQNYCVKSESDSWVLSARYSLWTVNLFLECVVLIKYTRMLKKFNSSFMTVSTQKRRKTLNIRICFTFFNFSNKSFDYKLNIFIHITVGLDMQVWRSLCAVLQIFKNDWNNVFNWSVKSESTQILSLRYLRISV